MIEGGGTEERTFHVFVSDSESLRLENATKDLLPWDELSVCVCVRERERERWRTTLNFKLAMEGMNRANTRARNWFVEAIEGLRDWCDNMGRRYKRYRQRRTRSKN